MNIHVARTRSRDMGHIRFMVHGFKPGKHVKKLYSFHKVSTNPWFQTMILHEVIDISNHVSYFKTITLSSNSLFQTMKAKQVMVSKP
jgi:hypothetical protein